MSAPITTVPLVEAMQVHFVLENKRDMLTPSERKTLLAVENLLKQKTASTGRYDAPPNIWTKPNAELSLDQDVTYMKFKELREVAKSLQPGDNATRLPSAYRLAVYVYNKLSNVASIFTGSIGDEQVAEQVDASAFRAFMVALKDVAHKNLKLTPEDKATKFIKDHVGASSEHSSKALHANLVEFFKAYDLCLSTYCPSKESKPQFWNNVWWSNPSDGRSLEKIYENETNSMTDVALNSNPDMLQKLLERLKQLRNNENLGEMPDDFTGGEQGLGKIGEITFTAEKEKVLVPRPPEPPVAFAKKLPLPEKEREVRDQFVTDCEKFLSERVRGGSRPSFWDKVGWSDGTIIEGYDFYKGEPVRRENLLNDCTVSRLKKVLARLEKLKSSDGGPNPEGLLSSEREYCTIKGFSFTDDAAKQAFLDERIRFITDLIPLMERYEGIVDRYTTATRAKAEEVEVRAAATRKQLLQNRIDFVENLLALSNKHDQSLFDQVREVQASTPVVSEISLPKAMGIHFVLAKKSEELTQEERKTLAVVENVLSKEKDSWIVNPGRILRVSEINEAQFSELEEAAKSTQSGSLFARAYRTVVHVRNRIFDSELFKNIWPNKTPPLGGSVKRAADDAVARGFFAKVDTFFTEYDKASRKEGASKHVETLLDTFITSYVNPAYVHTRDSQSIEGISGNCSLVRSLLQRCARERGEHLAKYTTQYRGNPNTEPELFWYALEQRAPGKIDVQVEEEMVSVGDQAILSTAVRSGAKLNVDLWEQEKDGRAELIDHRLGKEKLEALLTRLEKIEKNESAGDFSPDATSAERWLGSIDSIDVAKQYSGTYPLAALVHSRNKFISGLIELSENYDKMLHYAKETRELELAQPEPAEKQQELV